MPVLWFGECPTTAELTLQSKSYPRRKYLRINKSFTGTIDTNVYQVYICETLGVLGFNSFVMH